MHPVGSTRKPLWDPGSLGRIQHEGCEGDEGDQDDEGNEAYIINVTHSSLPRGARAID